MDIKNLYYSLDPKTLLNRVSNFLEDNLVEFQSQSKTSVPDCLRISELYLQATVVKYDGVDFIQKQGICIGSAVAPVLSDIYLSFLDVRLVGLIQSRSPGVILLLRYVDDILVCTTHASLSALVENFVYEGVPELKFSAKRPVNDCLQFIDIQIKTASSLCWQYGKTEVKPLLPFLKLSFEEYQGWHSEEFSR